MTRGVGSARKIGFPAALVAVVVAACDLHAAEPDDAAAPKWKDYVARPIPKSTEQTSLKRWKTYQAFIRRQAGEYLPTTTDPEEVRADAKRLYDDYYFDDGEMSVREKFDLVRSLRSLGARDPRLTAAVELALTNNGSFREADALHKELAAAAGHPSLTPYLRMKARWKLFTSIQYRKPKAEFQRAKQAMADVVNAWLVAGDFKQDEARCAWNVVLPFFDRDDYDIDTQRLFYAAIYEDQRIDPWLRHMAAGSYYDGLAWHHRGGSYASETSAEQFRLFDENSAIAEKHYKECYALAPQFPEAATKLIGISLGRDTGHAPCEWFDRAVAQVFDYEPAHRAYLYWLMPRWHGSFQQMAEFCDECRAVGRYDTNVPCLWLNLVSQEYGFNLSSEVLKVPGVYERTAEALEKLYQQRDWKAWESPCGDERATRFWHACIALQAGRYDEARRQFEKVGDFERWRCHLKYGVLRFPEDVARCYALTGPAKKEAAELVDLLLDRERYEPGLVEDARALLKRAAKLDSHPQSQWYFRHWTNVLDWEDRFTAGEEIELKFDRELAGLRPMWGKWKWESDRSVVGETDVAESRLDLTTVARFRDPYELSFDLETIEQRSDAWAQDFSLGYYPASFVEKHVGLCFSYSRWNDDRRFRFFAAVSFCTTGSRSTHVVVTLSCGFGPGRFTSSTTVGRTITRMSRKVSVRSDRFLGGRMATDTSSRARCGSATSSCGVSTAGPPRETTPNNSWPTGPRCCPIAPTT